MLHKFQILANVFERNLLEYLQSDQILEVYHANFLGTLEKWVNKGVNSSHYQSRLYWKAGKQSKGLYVTLHLDYARNLVTRHQEYDKAGILVFRVKASELMPVKIGETSDFNNSWNPDLSHSLDRYKEAIFTGHLQPESIKEVIYGNSHFSKKDFLNSLSK